MSAGTKIKKLREELNLTQSEVAEKLGVAVQTIFKYESEIVTNIPLDKLEKIATILNTTPAYLMSWDKKEDKITDTQLKFALFNGADGITDEMLEEVKKYAEFVMQKK